MSLWHSHSILQESEKCCVELKLCLKCTSALDFPARCNSIYSCVFNMNRKMFQIKETKSTKVFRFRIVFASIWLKTGPLCSTKSTTIFRPFRFIYLLQLHLNSKRVDSKHPQAKRFALKLSAIPSPQLVARFKSNRIQLYFIEMPLARAIISNANGVRRTQ